MNKQTRRKVEFSFSLFAGCVLLYLAYAYFVKGEEVFGEGVGDVTKSMLFSFYSAAVIRALALYNRRRENDE